MQYITPVLLYIYIVRYKENRCMGNAAFTWLGLDITKTVTTVIMAYTSFNNYLYFGVSNVYMEPCGWLM